MDSSSLSDLPRACVEELFEIVAATASAQRAARFEALCGAYPEHAARLRDLRGRVLAFDELIDGVATEIAADGDPAQIGPYRIVERLGEGGFGVVYRALQEEPLKREVALKLGREARASRAFLRRFELEREALAALDHPHVARILDAGRAIDGRPWFALEYIAGVPIDVYCEREALDLRARVELFRQVCEGLHHAHLRGILHRDLKPSNLLVATVVEPDGRKRAVAKVIDFGIARRLDEAGALSTAERTLEGQIVGTPEYLSPEQASLDPRAIDARSDVYGLGLVLQKLLVGALPFGRPAATPTGLHEHLRRVASEEPPAPRACFLRALERGEAPSAARENPRSWERALGSDLGWVLQRALACAKERRYQSVAALDEELARWLEHRAVLAGPPSVLYRASRFARRYRLQLGAALAVALALIAGTIVSLLYAREASESAAHSQQSELAAKRSESAARRSEQEAQQSRATAQENLERFLRMADGVVLDELEREARDSLGAPRPENLETMQGWIARAESLASRLVGHREMHALLRERAVAELGASGVEEPRLREPADQLLFEGLAKLVQRLELFAGASGTLARVRLRASWAAAHEEQSLRAQAAAWQRCIEELSRDPRFLSFTLRPQLGLVPLGADPGSKLQEFAVLATGAVPKRDAAGRLELDPDSALVLVLLPGGKFWMGTQAEDPAAPNHDPQAPPGCGPVHEVALEPFFCAKHELTQGQWQRAFLANPSRFRAGVHPAVPSLDFPVENLSHQDAELALRHLGLALPTEAQWEYAARAGTSTPWSTGDHARSLLEHANLADQAAKRAGAPWPAIRELPELDDGCVLTAIVGSFHPNPFGLHDLHGNVREFCVDLFVDYAGRSTRASDGLRVGEVGKLTGKEATGRAHMYVVRGGCYLDGPSLARSAYREAQLLDAKEGMFGVRAVRGVER